MEEHDDREGGAVAAGGGGEEAEPEVTLGVDGYVSCGDAVNGFGVWLGLAVEEAEETAVNGAVRATRCVR